MKQAGENPVADFIVVFAIVAFVTILVTGGITKGALFSMSVFATGVAMIAKSKDRQ